ncbi:MAG: response regulator [Bacteroidales bacterium]|jgi:signal transduction histidine kinase
MDIKPKILIVDDKFENLIALETVLRDANVEFIRALSGNEALAATLKHEFALAIVDVQMPDMDGYETVELIHNDPNITYFPVIFVSAIYNDERYVIKGIETGAVDFISKPIIPKVLKGKVKVFLDLYEQKKLLQSSNAELLKSKELAEKNNFLKSLFLATMSHEIRTPMNGILGVTELLKQTPLNQDQLDLINIMSISGENLLAIINDILDISKIESGMISLENVQFDLKKLISDSVTILTMKAREQNNNLQFSIADNVPQFLYGDPLRLKQIVINLINNAIKFTKNGSVSLGIKVETKDKDEVKLYFEITDTGIGITKEGLTKLFKSFSQVSQSTQREYGGTGLGLAIAKNLTELMNGEIGVRSKPGVGSTFWFTAFFNVRENAHTSLELNNENQPDTVQQFKTKSDQLKILLVEDNIINQKVAKGILNNLGFEVAIANNGALGLELYKKEKADIILMDIQMPVMDGFTATGEIRKYEEQKHLPRSYIVALTANALKEDREKCFAVGMNDFITKPFKADDINRVLELFK